ncbi:DUF2147 domain-containing protein [Mesorhizobium sp. IMUNJ 23232]|uniref:DUF2147 domain-containing protein n=1 Tax=Mesorhizobium sp. IMUNJ 23232 TaxID=3376064 RepID=UPI0037ACE2CE
MLRRMTMTASAMMLAIGAANADPIEGNWRTQSGETAAISDCGGGFCITLKTGKYKGKGIGKMSAEGGGTYSGSITDPAKDKTYSGSGTLSGGSLKMKGCVLGGLICRSQTWTKL